jgi:hypothetical protein
MPFGGPKTIAARPPNPFAAANGTKPTPLASSQSSMYAEVYEVLGFRAEEGSVEWWRQRAAEVQAEEEAASKGDLTRLDESGHAVAVTLPGPRAPTHEGHPAFGARMWPPVQSVTKQVDDPSWAKPAEEQEVPAWFLPVDAAADVSEDIAGQEWMTQGADEKTKGCIVS